MKRVAFITGVGRRSGTESDPFEIETELRNLGVRVVAIEADLADAATPASLMEQATGALGPVTALVLSHSESVDSSILTTTLESFDRHFAVNTRAAWLLVAEFARQLLDADIRTTLLAQQPTGRFGTPQDTADLVAFLLSDKGGWVSGQLIESNGGYSV